MRRLTLVNVSEGFEKGLAPLGLCYIASYLNKYGNNVDIRILDANSENIYANFGPTDLVGISSVTQDFNKAKKFGGFVKEKYDIPVIIGGVHISTLPKLSYPFDVGVIGEGEQTMLELMEIPDFSPNYLRKIKGICFGDEITERREPIDTLDQIPIPDRSLLNMAHYLKHQRVIPYHSGRTLSILTSRGCLYKCAFCSTSLFWQKPRFFSAERVTEEINQLISKYRIEILHIFDDLFMGNMKRFRRIVELIKKERINKKIKIMCLARADQLNDETMEMLKQINTVIIGVGMESGCSRILAYLKNRTVTVDDNKRAVQLAKKYKIPLMGSFMIGNPYEEIEDLRQTLKFVRNHCSNPYLSPLTYIATPFPGTELWNHAKRKGIALDNYDNYCMDIPGKIKDLRKAPILTDVDIEKFFVYAQKFRYLNALASIKGIALTLSFAAIFDEIKVMFKQKSLSSLKVALSHPFLFLKLLLNR